MLINILQCTEQPLPQRITQLSVALPPRWRSPGSGQGTQASSPNDIDVSSSLPCGAARALDKPLTCLGFSVLTDAVETVIPTTQHAHECQVFESRPYTVPIHRRCSVNSQAPAHFHRALLRCYNIVEGAEDRAASIWVGCFFWSFSPKPRERCRWMTQSLDHVKLSKCTCLLK